MWIFACLIPTPFQHGSHLMVCMIFFFFCKIKYYARFQMKQIFPFSASSHPLGYPTPVKLNKPPGVCMVLTYPVLKNPMGFFQFLSSLEWSKPLLYIFQNKNLRLVLAMSCLHGLVWFQTSFSPFSSPEHQWIFLDMRGVFICIFTQSDMSDLELTMSLWIMDFRYWSQPEVSILVADHCGFWGREWSGWEFNTSVQQLEQVKLVWDDNYWFHVNGNKH